MSNVVKTDSEITEWHEDGTYTTTVVYNGRPATRAEKAQAWGALGGLTLLAFAPVLCIPLIDKLEERRARKRAAKKTESEKKD